MEAGRAGEMGSIGWMRNFEDSRAVGVPPHTYVYTGDILGQFPGNGMETLFLGGENKSRFGMCRCPSVSLAIWIKYLRDIKVNGA